MENNLETAAMIPCSSHIPIVTTDTHLSQTLTGEVVSYFSYDVPSDRAFRGFHPGIFGQAQV